MLEKYDLFVVQHKILQYIRSVAPKVKNTFIDKAQTATIKIFTNHVRSSNKHMKATIKHQMTMSTI